MQDKPKRFNLPLILGSVVTLGVVGVFLTDITLHPQAYFKSYKPHSMEPELDERIHSQVVQVHSQDPSVEATPKPSPTTTSPVKTTKPKEMVNESISSTNHGRILAQLDHDTFIIEPIVLRRYEYVFNGIREKYGTPEVFTSNVIERSWELLQKAGVSDSRLSIMEGINKSYVDGGPKLEEVAAAYVALRREGF